jgi:predicted transcriptional regulator
MIATVRLDSELEAILNGLSKQFEKKRSAIIREAISFYAKSIENRKKNRLQQAIKKTANQDYNEYKLLDEILNDSFTK